jgi:hypothetical protein
MKMCLLIIALFSFLGCRKNREEYISGVEDLRLSEEQLSLLEKQVIDKSDAAAALRIARHYHYVLGKREEAIKWIRIAERLGSTEASRYRKEINDINVEVESPRN